MAHGVLLREVALAFSVKCFWFLYSLNVLMVFARRNPAVTRKALNRSLAMAH